MDKRTDALIRDTLARALGALEGESRNYLDAGDVPAVYRVEPPGDEAVVAAHAVCPGNDGEPFVTVMLGTPRRSPVTLTCAGCGVGLILHPPAEVIAYGQHGLLVPGRMVH